MKNDLFSNTAAKAKVFHDINVEIKDKTPVLCVSAEPTSHVAIVTHGHGTPHGRTGTIDMYYSTSGCWARLGTKKLSRPAPLAMCPRELLKTGESGALGLGGTTRDGAADATASGATGLAHLVGATGIKRSAPLYGLRTSSRTASNVLRNRATGNGNT